jgi:hypothetical protein
MAKKTFCRPPDVSATPKVSPKPNKAEEDIDQAVERVYQMYGPDLSVFFNAVQHQQQLERQTKQERNKPMDG